MTNDFSALSQEEYNKLIDAVSLITVYIAGADGEINTTETDWAEKIANIRSYNLPDNLSSFYKDVGVDFHDRIHTYIEELPNLPHTRNPIIEERLGLLNPILAKLPQNLGAAMYDTFISFAKHVAKATGGFFGFFSIGPKEAELLDLKMISPIYYVEED